MNQERLIKTDNGDELSKGGKTGSTAILNKINSELNAEYQIYFRDLREVISSETKLIILLGGESEISQWFQGKLSQETYDLIEYFSYKHRNK